MKILIRRVVCAVALATGVVPCALWAQIGTNAQFNSVLEVKQLSNEVADQLHSARFEGQVLQLLPKQDSIFIHDGTAGIYIQLMVPVHAYKGLRVGSQVVISGYTFSGGFSPILYTEKLTIVGWAPLPRATTYTRAMHESPLVDVDWVEMAARPTAIEYDESLGFIVISMEVLDTLINAFLPYSEEALEQVQSLLFREVMVSGVVGTTANAHWQMTGRILYVNSNENFVPLPEPSYEELSEVAIHELLQYGEMDRGLVRTRGLVLYATENEIYLRGEKAALKAIVADGRSYAPGDELVLTGYARLEPVSPSFFTRSIAKEGGGRSVDPLEIALSDDEKIDLDWNNELVSLEAEYVYGGVTYGRPRSGRQDALSVETLWCQAGDYLFEARLPEGAHVLKDLRPGSRLRLSGICHVSQNKNPRRDMMTEALSMQLPGLGSIDILQQPSWWTPERLLWGLSLALAASLLFLFWVVSLRRTVTRQTNTIGKQIERESVLNERQRIARELHDTLEQGLTALSLQLRRIYKKIERKKEGQLSAVELAEGMLQVCRNESRASIQDLRGGLLEKMTLDQAVRKTIKRRILDAESSVSLQVEVVGKPVRLTLFSEQQLLRMMTEAASNAVKHASAQSILVRLSYTATDLTVLVQDDGCGFDPAVLSETGRFGVQGMYERANRLNADLKIDSRPGDGTMVTLKLGTEQFVTEDRL